MIFAAFLTLKKRILGTFRNLKAFSRECCIYLWQFFVLRCAPHKELSEMFYWNYTREYWSTTFLIFVSV